MEDPLTPVKTVRNVKSNVEKFETLSLRENVKRQKGRSSAKTPVIEASDTTVIKSTCPEDTNQPSRDITSSQRTPKPNHKKQDSTAFLQKTYLQQSTQANFPDDARIILKSQPDHEDLIAVLHYLEFGIERKDDFNVRANSPKAAQILNVLATVTIPDHWARLCVSPLSKDDVRTKKALLACLMSVAGIGALTSQIKIAAAASVSQGEASTATLVLQELLSVLAALLESSKSLFVLLKDVFSLNEKPSQRHVVWQELVSLLAGGKVLSAAGEAAFVISKSSSTAESDTWLGDGRKFSKWLAANIANVLAALTINEEESWSMMAQMFRRSLSLGHSGKLRQ